MQNILAAAIKEGAFPGASVASLRGGCLEIYTAGSLGYQLPFDAFTTPETLYDLASLAKIYTVAAALLAFRDAILPLETSLNYFFAGFDERITLERLMAHASGISFPIQKLENVAADNWMAQIAAAPLVATPGEEVIYSCTNAFLLARVVEKVTGASLDEWIERRILVPLGLHSTTFVPRNLENVAPTEANGDGWFHGVVHDEAARSWRAQTGTCAGNAGLFAPAHEVLRFAQIWTQNGPHLLHPDDVSRALTPRWKEKKHWRGLGFQIDAPFYMSETAPQGTAGHLGFTGPSLCVHFETSRALVILNNRVHPTRFGPNRLPFHREFAAQFFAVP
ncbi:MAG TPA: serine hydrolase domain-containing protein [Abditibacterium sp.]|jgi:CubicO group peptidase (beta-lactamase class C family)